MQQFRNLTEKTYFKIFLAFIAVSFVMFGINSFMISDTNQWIVKIGDKQVSKREFMQLVQRKSAAALRDMDDAEAAQYLNSKQFQQDALNSLINQKRFEIIGEHFDFIANIDLILRSIAKDSNFYNFDGKFDRDSFNGFLNYNGITEKQYVDSLGKDVAADIVSRSIQANSPINEKIAISQEKLARQKRIADIVNISFKEDELISEIKEDQINNFYQNNLDKYIEPEKRQISYLEFSKEDLVKNIQITDDKVSQYYQDNIDNYFEPQTRDSLHILFDNKEEAQSFLNQYELSIVDKKTDNISHFTKLAKDTLNKDKDSLELNNITRQGIFPELAQEIFKLEINQHSQVIKSSIGYHVALLTKITQPKQIEFDKVKKDIKLDLIKQEKELILQQRLSEMDDNLLITNSIEKTAQKFSLSNSKTITIDNNGLNNQNKIEDVTKKFSEFLIKSFALDIDQISEIINDNKAKKFYVLKIEKIIPQNQKSLEDSKELVILDIIEQLKIKKTKELAQKIHQEMSLNPDSFLEIANKYKLKVDKNVILPRKFLLELKNKDRIPYQNEFLLFLYFY